jgi:dihydrofolate synthase/folylpolyglutamate synthase
LSLLTPISFDHTAVLGNTLPKIAFEKAGIIKPNKIVLTARQASDALAVIENVAREKNAALAVAERDWLWLGGHSDFLIAGAPRENVWREYWQVRDLHVPLLGVHQLANAGLAVAAAKTIQENWRLEIGDWAIRAGLEKTEWAGRLEILQECNATQPLIVTDGAHNGDSAEKLAAALKFHFEFEKMFLIFGALRDKNLDELLVPFVRLTARAWTVETNHPRSRNADDLAQALSIRGMAADAARDMQDALSRACAVASPRDLICITGSLSVAAMARAMFGLAHETDVA